jgi:hypothetical protein
MGRGHPISPPNGSYIYLDKFVNVKIEMGYRVSILERGGMGPVRGFRLSGRKILSAMGTGRTKDGRSRAGGEG